MVSLGSFSLPKKREEHKKEHKKTFDRIPLTIDNKSDPEGSLFILVSSFKLFEEAYIVLGEHAEVAHLVFQVGDTLHTQAEGITAVYLTVDAAELQHIGVYHAATEDLHPSGVLAETTAYTTADMTRDIHLGTGLCEGEVAGAQTDLRVRSEQLTSE